ncbi:MAG: IS3 family transposase [Deltaproteobacteria bacterium]|nr:IS3 family transposase [Deltaproteobacteria bacterium]
MVTAMHQETKLPIRRLAHAAEEPVSSVGRWVKPSPAASPSPRPCPVSGDASLRRKIKTLCDQERHQRYGHRRIRALLRRRYGIVVNRKTVARIMREEGLAQPKLRFKPSRPPHVAKMRPTAPNEAWQIDMTSFALSDLTPLYLIVVIDALTRKLVGWSLDRRCRASEWIAALRMALDDQGIVTREDAARLTVRSDNGAQPCSKRFVAFLGSRGVRGQYTGYDAPDDNAFVERVIRTIKEEEIWPTVYDTWSEAHGALDAYVRWYNEERIHSALDYRTPSEAEDEWFKQKAA